MSDASREYIIIGAGGHAAVIADILLCSGRPVKGYLDDNVKAGTEVLGVKVIGKTDDYAKYDGCLFIIGIGDNHIRKKIAQAYPLDYGTAVHPSAVVGREVEIGRGSVIMAGCVINARTVIGEHCIINTRVSVDHDCRIGDFTHISPGAVLGGAVVVGERSHVGLGASVRNNISICDDVIIGAGAAVVRDIPPNCTAVGVPAVPLKRKV